MEAALTAFLQNGYEGTSMDQIAALAAVSKQTVYKNFADKERLFTEIITDAIEHAQAQDEDLVAALSDSEDIEADLRRVARSTVHGVLQPHLLRMRRMIIGQADRFPDIARTWYERGPERAHAVLADHFRTLTDRGLLRVDDPLAAAQTFLWLVLSTPLNMAMFYANDEPGDLDRYADEAVRVFLAAYGAPSGRRS